MTIVGIGVFAIGWVYAIAAFGFFLGVGLGWIPALVIAWIADLLFVIAIAFVATMIASRRNIAYRPPGRDFRSAGHEIMRVDRITRFREPSRVSLAVTETLASLADRYYAVTRFLKRYGPPTVALVLIGGACAFVFAREFDGTCTRLQLAETRSNSAGDWFREQGINLNDLRTAGRYYLLSRYAVLEQDGWAWRKALEYREDSRDISRLENRLDWPQFCVYRTFGDAAGTRLAGQ